MDFFSGSGGIQRRWLFPVSPLDFGFFFFSFSVACPLVREILLP
jgi:hypothetical protein